MMKKFLIGSVLLLSLFLFGCLGQQQQATPTPVATITATSAPTSVPTATPAATIDPASIDEAASIAAEDASDLADITAELDNSAVNISDEDLAGLG